MNDTGFSGLVCTHWGHWRGLQMQPIARLALAPGQVRLGIAHAGVGFAVSLFVAGTYQRKPPLPFTPGTEASGVVLEAAPDVRHVRPGDRVVAALDWGAFAQEAVTTADTVYPVPTGLSLAHAAAMPITYGTTWSALAWRGQLQAGETLLVHGAGGALGMAAVQIGRLMGARVIATASTAEKREAALAQGAAHALSGDSAELAAAVKAIVPQGVDVVFDPVGGDLLDASLRCVAPGARLLVIGFAGGRAASVPTNIALVKNVAVIGFNYGYYIGWGLTDERARYAAAVQTVVGRALAAVAEGAMPPPRIQRMPFAQWEAAIDTVMSRRSVGKVILDIAPDLDVA